MQPINQEGWMKLTDEQRRIINCIIREFLLRNSESDGAAVEHADCDHLEIEHWYTGEL
jgi:hypothetical protein